MLPGYGLNHRDGDGFGGSSPANESVGVTPLSHQEEMARPERFERPTLRFVVCDFCPSCQSIDGDRL